MKPQQKTYREKLTFELMLLITILLVISVSGLFWRMRRFQGEMYSSMLSIDERLDHLEEMSGIHSSASLLPTEGLDLGVTAPRFTASDIHGNSISLSQFRGERVLLMFSSPECSACKHMFGQVRSFVKNNPHIHVLMVSIGPTEVNRAIVAKENFPFPVVFLPEDTPVLRAYKIVQVPFFYVIDERGVILAKGSAQSEEDIEALWNASARHSQSLWR